MSEMPHKLAKFYQEYSGDIWLAIASIIIGVFLTELLRAISKKRARKREARENLDIDITGSDWFAAWEASVDDEIIVNTEEIRVVQRGAKVHMENVERSPENPVGGYKWKSDLVFSHGETLMGWYFPLKAENLTSRGIMYFTYDPQRRLMAGKWVGKSFDGNLCTGFVCITKNRDKAREDVLKLIELAKRHQVNILTGGPIRLN